MKTKHPIHLIGRLIGLAAVAVIVTSLVMGIRHRVSEVTASRPSLGNNGAAGHHRPTAMTIAAPRPHFNGPNITREQIAEFERNFHIDPILTNVNAVVTVTAEYSYDGTNYWPCRVNLPPIYFTNTGPIVLTRIGAN